SEKIMSEGGYYEPPFMTPRWSKRSGEVYGWGPGHTALPDIKTLNKAKELYLRGLALKIQPPIKVRDQGVVGTVKLQPAGLTHVRDMEAVQALDLGVVRAGEFEIDTSKLQQDIRRIFFSDQLQLQEGPQMTAYEVQVRYELMQRILGPTLGRVEVELLNPYIERVFFMRMRRSAQDSPYRRIAEWCRANGVQLDVEYEGPLAKAQRLQESVAIQRFFQIVLPLGEANPDIFDLINLEEAIKVHAISTGVPTKILNDEDTVAAIREGKKQAREQEAKVKEMETMAGAVGKVSPLLDALQKMQGGMQQVQSPGLVPSGVGA
ncbi:MAG: portal protein, partial [Gammaproteobacteria bacterium]